MTSPGSGRQSCPSCACDSVWPSWAGRPLVAPRRHSPGGCRSGQGSEGCAASLAWTLCDAESRPRPARSPLVSRRLLSTCLASPHAAGLLTAPCLPDPSLGTGLPVHFPGVAPEPGMAPCPRGADVVLAGDPRMSCFVPGSVERAVPGQRSEGVGLSAPENCHRPLRRLGSGLPDSRGRWGVPRTPLPSPLKKSLLLSTALTTWVAGTRPEEGPSEALGLPPRPRARPPVSVPQPWSTALTHATWHTARPRPEGSVRTVLFRRRTALCA